MLAAKSKLKSATAPPGTNGGPASAAQSPSKPLKSEPPPAPQTVQEAGKTQLESWVHEQYVAIGFTNPNFGFIGYTKFLNLLQQQRPHYAVDLDATLRK